MMTRKIPAGSRSIPILWTLILVCVLAAIPGCTTDEPYEGGGTVGEVPAGESERSIILSLPGKPRVTSYAMQEIDENAIREIDLLVFADEGSQEKLLYHSTSNTISDINSDGTQKKVEIKISNTAPGQKVRFVLLANLRAEVKELGPKAGDLKSDIYDNFSIPVGKWNAKSSADFTPLPMWGETSVTFEIDENTTTFPTVKLLRSLARVDVGLLFTEFFDEPLGLGEDFVLDEVYVYNMADRAMVVPASANMDGNRAKSPTMPATYGVVPAYTYDDTEIKEKKSLLRTIYVAEQPEGSVADRDNSPCIIIGGTVNGKPKSYYRADFLLPQGPVSATDPDAQDIYLPVLRNHRYIFNVVQVDNIGYDTPEEALTHNPLNTVQIKTIFYDETIGSISYDGNYMLAMEHYGFSLDYYSALCTTLLMTDHPDGWEAEVEPGCDWIHLVEFDSGNNMQIIPTASGPQGVYTNLLILVEDNTSNENREGHVIVRFGRLEDKIKITQNEVMHNDGSIYVPHWDNDENYNYDNNNYPVEKLLYLKINAVLSNDNYYWYTDRRVEWSGYRASVPWGVINGINSRWNPYNGYENITEDIDDMASFITLRGEVNRVHRTNNYYWNEVIEDYVYPSDWSLTLDDPADAEWIRVFNTDATWNQQKNHSYPWNVIIKNVPKEKASSVATGNRSATLTLKCGELSRKITIVQDKSRMTMPKGFSYRDRDNILHTTQNTLMMPTLPTSPGYIYWGELWSGYWYWSYANHDWYHMMNVSSGWNGDLADDQQSPANTYSCAYLNEWNYLGYNDWRPPTPEETLSMVAYHIYGGDQFFSYGMESGSVSFISSGTSEFSDHHYYVGTLRNLYLGSTQKNYTNEVRMMCVRVVN